MSRIVWLGLLSALWLPTVWAHSYNKSLDQFVYQIWNTSRGLPQNSITKIVQSEKGFIWFGTHEGLVRFDGVEFRVFNHHNLPMLESNKIMSLVEDQERNLWFADERGKLYVLNEQLQCRRGPSLEIEDDYALTMMITRSGALWIGTFENGVFVYENNELRQIKLVEGESGPIWDFLEDDLGHVWVGSHRGLFRLAGDRVTRFTESMGFKAERAYCMEQDIQGRIWVGTNIGLSVIDGDTVLKADVENRLGDHSVFDIEEDQQGEMWLAVAYGGLARMRPNLKVHQTFTRENGLPNDNVATLLPDRDGNMWVGIESGGLACFRNGPAITWTQNHGLPHDMVRSVLYGAGGKVWVGTDNGLALFDGVRFTPVDLGITGGSITALYDDGKGGLWVGAWGRALVYYRPSDGKTTVYEEKAGLPATSFSAITGDADGNIWIATRKGLVRLRGGFFETFTVHQGLPTNLITSLLQTRDGALWIGTRGGGLVHFDNDGFTTYTNEDGLSSNQILALYEDADGALWIGTSDNGLNRMDQKGFRFVNVADGLFDDKILSLHEDANGLFWMSANRGIFALERATINAYLDQDPRSRGETDAVRLQGRTFGVEDGMKSSECNGGTFPSATVDALGNIWVATIEGVVSLDGNHEYQQGEAPPVFISQVKLNGKTRSNFGTLTIPPGSNKLEIHFSGVNLTLSKRLQFRYQMVGLDDEPRRAERERTAFFTNLPPGKYQFRVWAGNEPDFWGEDYAEIGVVKSAAWYQKNSVRLAAICLIMAMVFGLDRYRLRRNSERHALLEHMVQERSAVLQGTHQRLIKAQEQVIEAAHRAGMAEIACNVLHQVEDVVNRVEQESRTAKQLFEGYIAPQALMKAALVIADPSKARAPENAAIATDILSQLRHLPQQKQTLAEQLSRINNQVFQLTQIVSAQQKYAKQDDLAHSVDINALIADAVKIKNKDLRRTQAEVIQDLSPVPTFYLQRAKILRVLLGLLQHCCESMSRNEPTNARKIFISTYLRDNHLEIHIRDTGPCVPDTDLTGIFAQNASPRATSNRFVLHACANAVSEMDGDIQAYCAADGNGMVFVLRFPVQEEEPIKTTPATDG